MQDRPEDNGEDHDGADEDPNGIAASVSGLRPADLITHCGRAAGNTVYGTVDNADVHNLPKYVARNPHQGTNYNGLIKLIHVIFVVEKFVQAFGLPLFDILRVHAPRHYQTSDGREHSDTRERKLQAVRSFTTCNLSRAQNRRK